MLLYRVVGSLSSRRRVNILQFFIHCSLDTCSGFPVLSILHRVVLSLGWAPIGDHRHTRLLGMYLEVELLGPDWLNISSALAETIQRF